MANLPQRPRQHVLDTLAEQFCRHKLPPEWKVDKPQQDYGIDLDVEIVVNQEVTGAHFSIQLKGTDHLTIRKGKYISHSCKVSTLNYFRQRTELVIYLVYDDQRKKGFWIWVQDYIRNELKIDGWQNKEEQTIRIPLSNVFDENAIRIIQHRVLTNHMETRIFNAIKTAHNPDLNYFFQTTRDQALIRVEPKQPDKPIVFDPRAVFKFDDSLEGQIAKRDLDNHFRTGIRTTIDARFINMQHVYQKTPELVAELSNLAVESLELGEPSSDKILPFKMVFLDEQKTIIREEPYIAFRKVRHGTDEIAINNFNQPIPLKIQIVFNHVLPSVSMNLHFELESIDAVQYSKFLVAEPSLRNAKWMKLIELNSGACLYEGASLATELSSPLSEEMLECVNNLAFIQEKLNQPIKISKYIDNIVIHLAQEIVKILRTGISETLFTFVPPTFKFTDVKIFIDQTWPNPSSYNEPFMFREEGDDLKIDLLGVQIDLGPYKAIYSNVKFRAESLKNLIELPANREFNIEFDTLEAKFWIEFERWLPKKENPD